MRSRATLLLAMLMASLSNNALAGIAVSPAEVRLHGRLAGTQLLLDAETDGHTTDVTRDVRFTVEPAGIVDVSASGYVKAVADGRTTIRIDYHGETFNVAVEVRGVTAAAPANFQRDVMPILSRYSC